MLVTGMISSGFAIGLWSFAAIAAPPSFEQGTNHVSQFVIQRQSSSTLDGSGAGPRVTGPRADADHLRSALMPDAKTHSGTEQADCTE